jgi:hypothetical protein
MRSGFAFFSRSGSDPSNGRPDPESDGIRVQAAAHDGRVCGRVAADNDRGEIAVSPCLSLAGINIGPLRCCLDSVRHALFQVWEGRNSATAGIWSGNSEVAAKFLSRQA